MLGTPWKGYYLTAYGIAVKHGFKGTEEDWLESLRGEPGAKVQLRFNEETNCLEWKSEDGGSWEVLMYLSDLQTDVSSSVVARAMMAAEDAKDASAEARAMANTAITNAGKAEAAEKNILQNILQYGSIVNNAYVLGDTLYIATNDGRVITAGNVRGPKGDAPKKGVDYWTEKELAEMLAEFETAATARAEAAAEAAEADAGTATAMAGKAEENAGDAEKYAESARNAQQTILEHIQQYGSIVDGAHVDGDILYITTNDGKIFAAGNVRGETGYTPRRGVDYWTEEDRAGISADLKEIAGNAGYGDMVKATYDADGDGVVDDAKKLGGKLPSEYAESVHTHTPADLAEAVPVEKGGHGGTTAAEARENLEITPANIGAQATVTGAATTVTGSNLTASRALVSNSSGKIGVSAVTSTELGYLDGVTSNVQTQLNGKTAASAAGLYTLISGRTALSNTEIASDDYIPVQDTSAATGKRITVDNLLNCKIVTSAGTGAAYTATVPGITSLKAGVSFIMIPHTANTSTAATLNVNSLGAKTLRRAYNYGGTTTYALEATNTITTTTPLLLMYNGTYWVILNMLAIAAGTIEGTLPVSNGGTGNTSVDTTPTSGSSKMVTSGGVYTALASKSNATYIENGSGTNSLKQVTTATGNANTASEVYAVSFGSTNTASNACTFNGGGSTNTASGTYSGTVAGSNNSATAAWSGVFCGSNNTVTSEAGLIGGVVLGGLYNTAQGACQAVVGRYNTLYAGATSGADTTGSMFIVGIGTGTSARSNGFRVDNTGKCRGLSSWGSSGADYAEYFEWADGNPENEDRRGLFVTLDGNKIRKATSEDDYILGVISATPVVVGNTWSDEWQGRFLTDIFGERLTEVVDVPETTNEETGEIIPAHKETHFILNPEYDPEKEYVSREDRQEWGAVGMVGQLVAIDDGTCEVNGYCKVTDESTATKADGKTDYRVVERLDNSHIRIVTK